MLLLRSPNPHAWLRPFFTRLLPNPVFTLLSPSHQFQQLREAVASEHPAQAIQMGEWSTGAQEALLRHLAESEEESSPPAISVLWRLIKDARELRCIAQYLSTGIDVRLLEGPSFHRTQLCHTA